MKRFTETNKWRDPWFRQLSSPAKQLWGYLTDNCDAVGLVEIAYCLVTEDCRQRITKDHMIELGDRVQWISDTKFFIPKFIDFQYGKLSETCPAHRPVLRLVARYGLLQDGIAYRYPIARVSTQTVGNQTPSGNSITDEIPIGYPSDRVQDKEKDKEKEKEKEGGVGETKKWLMLPDGFRNPKTEAAWVSWVTFRKEIRHSLTESTAKKQIELLLTWGEEKWIQAINTSIEKGWQGLFEPNGNGNTKGSGTYQRGSTENPRNVGTCPSTTNYAEVVRRKQAAQVAGQMALSQVGASPTVDGIGK